MPSLQIVSPSLDDLRSLLQPPAQRESFQYSVIPTGVPKGKISVFYGPGKSQAALNFLKEHEFQVAWIEEDFTLFPFAFFQQDLELSRVLFIDAKKDIHWTLLETLRSELFPVIVVHAKVFSDKMLRRFQLAAEHSKTAVIILSETPQNSFCISLEVECARLYPQDLKISPIRIK